MVRRHRPHLAVPKSRPSNGLSGSWSCCGLLFAGADDSRFSLELEAGSVWQGSNDVQIPNSDLGTRFSLKDLVGTGPWPAGRVYFTWNINQKHGLRLLLAPLSYTESGFFDEDVLFAGEAYESGVPTEATYQFNYAVVSGVVRF